VHCLSIHSTTLTSGFSPLKLVWPIALSGFVVGCFLSFSIVSGDQLGRVNLFYLLFIFVFIPLLTALLSMITLITKRGISFASLVIKLPLLSNAQRQTLRQMQQLKIDRHWLFIQGQYAAIFYACGGLVTFLLLLLGSDVNFVWRSTILSPEDIHPFLKWLAMPWQFWSEAQPDMSLLIATQDNRLMVPNSANPEFSHWWKFILATQLCYSLLLRLIMILPIRWIIAQQIKNDFEQQLKQTINRHQKTPSTSFVHADIVHQLPNELCVVNWAEFSQQELSNVSAIKNFPLIEISDLTPDQTERSLLVLVKAWEPPIGELEDFLKEHNGFLYPIDFKHNNVIGLEEKDCEEWQRFTAQLTQWNMFQPPFNNTSENSSAQDTMS